MVKYQEAATPIRNWINQNQIIIHSFLLSIATRVFTVHLLFRWTFTGDPRNDNNDNPYNGTDYELWNYVWYTSPALRDDITANSEATYGADNLLNNVKGFYVRKRSDDRDVNSTSRYEYTQASGFTRSASPYMEIRFAEVLLNYAEAACGAGHLDEAVAQLQRIRARVGYTAENNCKPI